MIIDSHAHIYPEKIAQKAVESVGAFYTISTKCGGTADELLSRGKKAGIDRFVVHSAAQSPQQVKSINDFISNTCKENPEFIGFGTLHIDMEHPEDEIDRMECLGIKGVKMHPDIQQFDIDDIRMHKIYSILENRLPILMHCGDYRYSYSHPKRLRAILEQFPNLTVIAAHFGGWSIFDLAVEYLKDTNCFLDISSSVMFLGNKRSEELISIYGSERILFGSDYPMWDPAEELERFYRLNISSGNKELILNQNILRVLGL